MVIGKTNRLETNPRKKDDAKARRTQKRAEKRYPRGETWRAGKGKGSRGRPGAGGLDLDRVDRARPRVAVLPGELQGELELARVVGCSRLTRKAGGAAGWIAELVHRRDVGAVQEVEAVGDKVELEVFAEGNFFGDAQVKLEEAWAEELVASERAIATGGRRDLWYGELRAVVCQATVGNAEVGTGNERGSRAAT